LDFFIIIQKYKYKVHNLYRKQGIKVKFYYYPGLVMSMRKRESFFGILAIVALLLLSSMLFVNVSGVETIEYDLELIDPEGDAEGTLVEDQATEDNADIMKITSAKVEDLIVLTMTVKGYINTSDMTTYQNGYQFNIDINNDQVYDWLATASYMMNYGGTDSQLQQDMDEAQPALYYLENATGIGTNTVTIKFPISYITDVESIESWDIYGTSSSVKSSTFASYVDTAPDEGFSGGGSGLDPSGDEDQDGMPNGWETDNGLDPYDSSDASDDDDGDGYTNFQEYKAGTDPQDPASKPSDPGVELKIVIIKPKAGDEIPPGGMGDTYKIEGTTTVPAGDSIDIMEFRVVDAMVSDWQPVYDDSGASDYSKWYGELDTYTVEGQCAMMNKGENKLEVKATTINGKTTTATVKFKFNPDGGDVPDDMDNIGQETPTDTTITVNVAEARMDVEVRNNKVYVSYVVKGTTSGVDHCELVSVNYYDDGSYETDVEWMEEFDQDGFSYAGVKFEIYHFKATSENWKTWEYVVKGEMTQQDYNETSGDEEGKETVKTVVYVRAYSDPTEKNWNQGSKAISIASGDDGDDDDDDDDGSPGFESVIFIGAVSITLIFIAKRRRR
jgi:hypothetical protein